jgi:hypothetical protein
MSGAIDSNFISISYELDESGLVWKPEIGDEVVARGVQPKVSILIDPQGMSPSDLRKTFVWLPTVEQLVSQIEARQGVLFHAGISKTLQYEAVIKTSIGLVEATANTLRSAFAVALNSILVKSSSSPMH